MKAVLQPVLKILAGTASAQFLSVLILPLISRLYTPADYGIFGMVLAIVGVVVIVVTFQFHQAIVLPSLDHHGIGLFQLACIGSLAGGVLTMFCAMLCPASVYSSVVSPFCFSLTIGLAVIVVGISQSVLGVVVRQKAFGFIGVASMIRVIAMAAVQIGMGVSNFGYMGLLLGYLVGELLATIFLCWRGMPKLRQLFVSINLMRRYALIRRYRDFATYGTAQETMNSASQGLPVILLGAFFGQAVAGYYAFAIRILMAPGQLIANSVRQVLSQRFASHVRFPELLLKEFKLTTFGLAAMTLLGALVVTPWLVEMFVLLFGKTWMESGEYGNWLIFWVAFAVFNVPSSVVIRTLRRQKENFFLNLLFLTSRIGCLVLGGMYWSPIETVAVFAILGIVLNMTYIGMAWWYLPNESTT